MATKWGVEGGFAEWNGEDGEEKRGWGEDKKDCDRHPFDPGC